MANEIGISEGQPVYDGNGNLTGGDYLVFYYIPIPAGSIIKRNGVPVVPTPVSELPQLVQDDLTGTEKTAIGTGAATVVVAQVPFTNQQTNAEAAAILRQKYDAAKAKFFAEYAQVYKNIGTRIAR